MSLPAYLRIAADLREQIVTGQLAAEAKLPTETALMEQYGVSRTVAKYAIGVLKGEGLVDGVRGSGVYVRSVRRIVREAHGRNLRAGKGPTSPFARDAAAAGRASAWEHESEHALADLETARRLGIAPGDPVMCTRYRFLADGEPIQLSTSYEPLSITGGTAVEWPEDCGIAGVVARFDAIDVRIDEFEERVSDRPATTRGD
jgi:DNA-binding GntR family transcriptional regulator